MPKAKLEVGNTLQATRVSFEENRDLIIRLTVGFAFLNAGFFALIIPGLIILTLISVAGQAVVVDRTGIFDSLGRSFNLVKENAWRVFGYLLVIGLLGMLVLLLCLLVTAPLGTGLAGDVALTFLSNLLSSPILAVGAATLYSQLVDLQPEVPAETEDPYSG